MTAGIWVAGAVVLIGFIVAVVRFVMYLIDKPEGGHHRPPWWQRWRDGRAQERAQDALNLRLIHDISEGIRRETTGPLTSSGMGRPEWPLAPLPPGVEEHADHFHRVPLPPEVEMPVGIWRYDGPGLTPEQLSEFRQRVAAGLHVPLPPEPEDPHEVVTPEDAADAYIGEYARDGAGEMVPKSVGSLLSTPEPVGLAGQPGKNGSDEAGLIGPIARSLPSPAPEPEPAPLTDFRETTGSWEALVNAVVPKDGA